jgi:hypothetical protein
MKKLAWALWLALLLSLACFPSGASMAQSQSEDQEEEENVLVGRITYIEGEILRYVPDEEDWVVTVADAPFGLEDALYSDEDARAELIMPNETWFRIDGETQIQLIELQEDFTEIDVASGIARFYNKGSETEIKVTTPFGYVSAAEGTVFDVYVGEESVEVIALAGTVDYVHEATEERYEVTAGSASLLADNEQVSDGEGVVNEEWDEWNKERDEVWRERIQVKGDSVQYLPRSLHHDAYSLERHGRWERVQYEGEYRNFWRPVNVDAGWQPFTQGRWTEWYGDQCWVPDEPFGYVTHHYGNWVYASDSWYWAPPVVRVGVSVGPALDICNCWYPGRVAWIHSGVHVGWVPLAPFEPYYGHRRWGRGSLLITGVNVTRINFRHYKYFNRAVIINKRHFYNVRSYRNVRITHIDKRIITKRYRGSAVINDRVIRGYGKHKNRHNFTNVKAHHKPHRSVVDRIHRNRDIARKDARLRGKDVRRDVKNIKHGRIDKTRKVKSPKSRSKMVPAKHADRPESKTKFKERDLKKKQKTRDRIKGKDKLESEREDRKGPRKPSKHLTPERREQRTKERREPRKPTEGKDLQRDGRDRKLQERHQGERTREGRRTGPEKRVRQPKDTQEKRKSGEEGKVRRQTRVGDDRAREGQERRKRPESSLERRSHDQGKRTRDRGESGLKREDQPQRSPSQDRRLKERQQKRQQQQRQQKQQDERRQRDQAEKQKQQQQMQQRQQKQRDQAHQRQQVEQRQQKQQQQRQQQELKQRQKKQQRQQQEQQQMQQKQQKQQRQEKEQSQQQRRKQRRQQQLEQQQQQL